MAVLRSLLFALIFYGWTVAAVLLAFPISLFGTKAIRGWCYAWVRFHRFCATHADVVGTRGPRPEALLLASPDARTRPAEPAASSEISVGASGQAVTLLRRVWRTITAPASTAPAPMAARPVTSPPVNGRLSDLVAVFASTWAPGSFGVVFGSLSG